MKSPQNYKFESVRRCPGASPTQWKVIPGRLTSLTRQWFTDTIQQRDSVDYLRLKATSSPPVPIPGIALHLDSGLLGIIGFLRKLAA